MSRVRSHTMFTRGDRLDVDLVTDLPVPAVAKAVAAFRDEDARFTEARRARDAAAAAAENATAAAVRKAAEEGIKKGELPKDIRREVKAVKAVAEEAQLQLDARAEILRHAYARLVAVLEANRDALVEASLAKAKASVQRMAAAREAFASAAVEAEVSYGVLGLFARARHEPLRPKLLELPKSRRKASTQKSLAAMSEAVGFADLDLTAFVRGTEPTRAEFDELEGDDE